MRNTFKILVFSKEYTFLILLVLCYVCMKLNLSLQRKSTDWGCPRAKCRGRCLFLRVMKSQRTGVYIVRRFIICSLHITNCLATDWTAGRSGFDPQQRQEDFSFSLCAHIGSGAHPASYTMDTGGPFPGGKARSERNANHSPHLVPRSWMSRSCTSSPPTPP
jgi:hypothetical protein